MFSIIMMVISIVVCILFNIVEMFVSEMSSRFSGLIEWCVNLISMVF